MTRPPHILIACMPKSGSTFLSSVIAELPGFRRAHLTPAYGRREQELDRACLRQADPHGYVAQHHVRYSAWTARMSHEHGLAPVVLVRNLPDAVVSLRDHLRRESVASPIFHAEAHHASLDDATLEAMIVRLALPWYVNFYMGWRQAPNALFVTYADLVAAPVQTVRRVLDFAGASTSEAEVEAAVRKVGRNQDTRMNVGVTGRGATLPAPVMNALLELLDFYPEAAEDPYIRRTRDQAAGLIAGAVEASTAVVSPHHTAAAWRPGAGLERFLIRCALPVVIAIAAVLYWIWPNDVVPDGTHFGQVDDVALLLLGGLVAGRLTLYRRGQPTIKQRPA